MQMLSYQNLTLVWLQNYENQEFLQNCQLLEQQFNKKNKKATGYINKYF